MATYYFDEDGIQLIQGLGAFDEGRVAYSTKDENDIIFTRLPPGKKFKIVDGEVTIMEHSRGGSSFAKFVSNMRDKTLSAGLSVNCMTMQGDDLVRKTIAVPIADKIKSDINFIITAYDCGMSRVVPVRVGDGATIVISTKQEAMDLFLAGTLFVIKVSEATREANALANQGLTEEEFQTQVTALFSAAKKTITI